LVCTGENMPLDLLMVRDDDIPGLLEDGSCEAGVAGLNVLEEHRIGRQGEEGFSVWRELDFGGCRLAVAVPERSDVNSVEALSGRRIATTYPGMTKRYFTRLGIAVEVVVMSGAVELAPRLGKADAICDLVSTGTTLKANHLRELETVFQSRAALAVSKRPMNKVNRNLLATLERRMEGVLQVNGSKYVMLHAPRAQLATITAMLPGAESPTILPLEGDADKVAVHAVCGEAVFWETLERLKAAGASTLLVLPIEKMLA
ncbi:MAG: ATP phosphoribosyltransferase, partial [Sinobacteraceae bacterium]|nr:ATP phosphoribosyltransferase [Nevskiaceae bacterium]